jgi:hypothetical protein
VGGALDAHLAALLAPDSDYEERYSSALEWHERAGEPFPRARTQLALGERLRRDGRRWDARPHLHEALATFERLGARPWAARAAAELRETGERVRTRDARGEGSLTPQELQVALVVAGGATNREVCSMAAISDSRSALRPGRRGDGRRQGRARQSSRHREL